MQPYEQRSHQSGGRYSSSDSGYYNDSDSDKGLDVPPLPQKRSLSNKVDSASRREIKRSISQAADDMKIKLPEDSLQMLVDTAHESQASGGLFRTDGDSTIATGVTFFHDQVHDHGKTGWRNQKKFICWLVLYYIISLLLFMYKVTSYLSNQAVVDLFSPFVAYTRGAALLIDFNATLVLFPVCRHFMTWIQSRRFLRGMFAFDAAIDSHILFGGAILLLATAHTVCHCFTYSSFVGADVEDVEAFFGEEVASTIPTSRKERILFLLKMRATWTGILMWLCMVAGFSVIRSRRTNFNKFWYFHHLLFVMLILLGIHGTGNVIEPAQTGYFLAIPITLYFIPRMYRECSNRTVKFISYQVCNDIIELVIEKPQSWRMYQKPGMYACINIPAISRFEWHPFTMSSAPQEDHLTFHIDCVGDWTKSMREHLIHSSKVSFGVPDIAIRLDGPFGAPCQGARDFENVVLVGAGVGVTPMISTLKGLLHKSGKARRVYFYWTSRDSCSFKLFAEQMDKLYDLDSENRLVIRHFLTSAKGVDENDPNLVVFKNAVEDVYTKTHIDVRLGHRTNKPMSIGRPDWSMELGAVMDEAWALGLECTGLFLCGGAKMAEQVQTSCVNLSKSHKGHIYFTKETF